MEALAQRRTIKLNEIPSDQFFNFPYLSLHYCQTEYWSCVCWVGEGRGGEGGSGEGEFFGEITVVTNCQAQPS